MKSTILTRRVAAVGAATALAAGALVATTGTTATAAPVSNTYTCGTSAGPQQVDVDIEVPGIGGVTQFFAGQAVDPMGAFTANLTFTISDDFHSILLGLGVTDLEVPAYAAKFGNSKVPLAAFETSITDMTQNPDDTWSDSVSSPVIAFKAPSAGIDQNAVTPPRINILATIGGNPVDVVCDRNDAAQVLTTVDVFANDSTTAAKSTKACFEKGTAAKVKVKVSADNKTPTGTVILKKGSRTLDKGKLKKGAAVLSTKALGVGKNKLTVVYKGDSYTNGSKDTVTVKVVR